MWCCVVGCKQLLTFRKIAMPSYSVRSPLYENKSSTNLRNVYNYTQRRKITSLHTLTALWEPQIPRCGVLHRYFSSDSLVTFRSSSALDTAISDSLRYIIIIIIIIIIRIIMRRVKGKAKRLVSLFALHCTGEFQSSQSLYTNTCVHTSLHHLFTVHTVSRTVTLRGS
jgi:hypothetical protein